MVTDERENKKIPCHCSHCGGDLSSSHEKCPQCDTDVSLMVSRMEQRFVGHRSDRVTHQPVRSGRKVIRKLKKTGDRGLQKEEGWKKDRTHHEEVLEDMLGKVDDKTFELRGTDNEHVVDNIKKFASLLSESMVSYHIEFSYTCPSCMIKVTEDCSKCPGCGVLFED